MIALLMRLAERIRTPRKRTSILRAYYGAEGQFMNVTDALQSESTTANSTCC